VIAELTRVLRWALACGVAIVSTVAAATTRTRIAAR
jgi:hypothetical protein